MKILQVTNFFKPSWESGGPARVVYELSKKLTELGHEVTVYTTDGFKSRLDVEKNTLVYVDGIRVYYFRSISNYISKNMNFPIPYYLPVVARREIMDFDIIHIHEHRTLLSIVVNYYARKYKIPYVLQAHGSVLPFFQKQRLKRIFDLFAGNRILKDASLVIALNRREAEQYKKMNMDVNKIKIVPNGIELSEFDNLPMGGEFRRRYLIGDNEKIILYLGRIHRIKGIDLLVEAFADLANEFDDVRLVIVGPDDGFLPTLKKQIRSLNMNDKILLTGAIYEKDRLRVYADADVFVLPSIYETFPVTVFEASACGVPVVVTVNCGVAEFIDGMAGYVVGYDKYQLRDAIFKILTDNGLRKRFEEGGKMLVRKFDIDNIVKKIENIYNEYAF